MSFRNTSRDLNYYIIWKLIIASILISVLSALLAIALKHTTEYLEGQFFLSATTHGIYLFIFPMTGLFMIHFMRHYLFKKKENKGIKEIFEVTQSKNKNLPLYKIPSHFVNGLFTVIFGGATGIEVSTVVATAAIGGATVQKEKLFKNYKTELICTGITAGITVLFSSPIAGILFSIEVIAQKKNSLFYVTNGIAITIASALLLLVKEKPLFSIVITTWHFYAVPYFILLGILAGVNSVFLTKMVLFFKSQFLRISNGYYKIILGALIIGFTLLIVPQLYGDGYHAMRNLFTEANPTATMGFILTFVGILILKPIATSVTLASGGDGGVFAPSLFIGAFLGLFVATVLNTFFKLNVIPVNFMILGMAAVLSASIHAPLTASFLVCGIINDYTLLLPLLAVCYISKYTSKKIFPFTVYNYNSLQFRN